MITPEFVRPLLKAPVAILGAGASGRAVLALLGKMGATGVIFDEKAAGPGIVSNFAPVAARHHRLVVFSPGFPPQHPWLKVARAAGCECLGELDFAALFWQGQVVAITGTNGKTTLTEFLTHALGASGGAAVATGNIGFPFSQLVADADGGTAGAIAVCEVSSFQAETLQHFRSDATLWTNFAEDHLERHHGMADYFAAKKRLATRTKAGAVFVGTSVEEFARKAHVSLADATIVSPEVNREDLSLANTVFARQPQRENYLLALAWWRHAGRPEAVLQAAARTFRLGRHQLTRVAEIDGVTWWNDSKATNFHAVEAALRSFAAPVIVILGGKGKGGDVAGFIERIVPYVKHAFLLGETKAGLALACEARQVPCSTCTTLSETVQQSAEMAQAGDNVLLSPGFASFDLFLNYQDRGDQFESLVNNLGATASLG